MDQEHSPGTDHHRRKLDLCDMDLSAHLGQHLRRTLIRDGRGGTVREMGADLELSRLADSNRLSRACEKWGLGRHCVRQAWERDIEIHYSA
jgi:hypothetical protein